MYPPTAQQQKQYNPHNPVTVCHSIQDNVHYKALHLWSLLSSQSLLHHLCQLHYFSPLYLVAKGIRVHIKVYRHQKDKAYSISYAQSTLPLLHLVISYSFSLRMPFLIFHERNIPTYTYILLCALLAYLSHKHLAQSHCFQYGQLHEDREDICFCLLVYFQYSALVLKNVDKTN